MDTNGGYSPEPQRGRSRSRSPDESREERDDSLTREKDKDRQQRGNRAGRSGGGGGVDRRSRAPPTRRVYVANIPYESKWTEVKDLFREKVGDVSYVELFQDDDGKFRGCGIVELKDSQSVQKAIDVLHRFEYKNRQLVVKEDYDVDRDKNGRPVPRGGSRSSGERGGSVGRSGSGSFNTFGLNPDFLKSLGINGPLTSRVFVANLDYKVTSKKLQDIFKMAGKVQSIELKTDKDGNSKGHGTIEFEHPLEAVQGISMLNGQKLFGRSMSVRMDKFGEESDGASKLPAGLQGIGKGLGAGGQPLHLANAALGIDNVGNSGVGLTNVGLATSGNLGMMGSANLGLGNTGVGMGVGNVMGSERGLMGAGLGVNMAAANSGLANGGVGMGMGVGASGGIMGAGLAAAVGGGAGMMGAGGNLGGMGRMGDNSGSGAFSDMNRNYERRSDMYSSSQSSDTIAVRNLPNSVSWQNVREKFRECGDVMFAEVKGRGAAIVRFSSERAAQRAVSIL